MIDLEKIKKASEDFSLARTTLITMKDKKRMQHYFNVGVKWCFNMLWHKAREMPEAADGVPIVCIMERRGTASLCVQSLPCRKMDCEEWELQVSLLYIRAWAYMEDLLPATLTKGRDCADMGATRKLGTIDEGDIIAWTDGNGEEWIGRVESKDANLNIELYPCISRRGEEQEWRRRFNYGNDTWTVSMNDIKDNMKSATDEQVMYGDCSTVETFWKAVRKIMEITEEDNE